MSDLLSSELSGSPEKRTFTTWSRDTVWLILILAALLGLQSYWYCVTSLLEEINAETANIERLEEEVAQMKAVVADNAPPTPAGQPGSLGSEDGATAILLEPLTKKLLRAQPQLENIYDSLAGLLWFLGSDAHDALSRTSKDFRTASNIVQLLSMYFLPMLYGIMGGFIRGIQSKLGLPEDGAEAELARHHPRRILYQILTGAVAGPMITLFNTETVTPLVRSETAPFFWAFLAGYSTDIFYAILRRLSSSIMDVIGEKPRRLSRLEE
ncbi:MAG TPA: hypothetical protein VHL08_00615 [Dongiaceae bacterium]|jgi:hypothetical protein|nr:hypothetical protein [Dongiaceae bacterium]